MRSTSIAFASPTTGSARVLAGMSVVAITPTRRDAAPAAATSSAECGESVTMRLAGANA